MQIFVKVAGKTITLEVAASDKVGKIRVMIQELEGKHYF